MLDSPARVHVEVTAPTEHDTAHEMAPARTRDLVGMQSASDSWSGVTAAPMDSRGTLSTRCDSARDHETVVDVPAPVTHTYLERRGRGSVFRNNRSEVRLPRPFLPCLTYTQHPFHTIHPLHPITTHSPYPHGALQDPPLSGFGSAVGFRRLAVYRRTKECQGDAHTCLTALCGLSTRRHAAAGVKQHQPN